MSPDVLARKLRRLSIYLDGLTMHNGRTAEDISADPYAVERLLELLVQVSVDILSHLLAESGVSPASYRETFELAGEHGLLPTELTGRLARAAGLRNILVHLYEEIDYDIVAASIRPALEDFGELIRQLELRLRDPK